MCGIAGAIGPNAEPLVRAMTAALVHRGPDDDGFHLDAGLALGFRRLSIIDVAGGHQPIANETGDLVLICNGEIYNSPALRRRLEARGHRFRSHSDVEVILHLYEELGPGCVRELRGMFAFALWDAAQQTLMLARDPLGQKPLFFFQDGERFLFASEVQALLASGAVARELNLDGLWHYLALRSLPDQHTMIRDIRKLPAASVLLRSPHGGTTIDAYWRPQYEPKLGLSERDAIDALDACLQESVQAHLLSDVRVGTFLSGGIDSTTLAVMMSRGSPGRVPAFSIGVEEASFDELDAARRVAAAENMEFHGVRVHADIARLLPEMIHHLGEPADPYAVGTFLASRLAAGSVKVVLSGDGGDELFGGYDRYVGQRLVDVYALMPAWLRRSVMPKLIAAVPETNRYKSLAQQLRWLHSLADVAGGERYAHTLGALRFTPDRREALFHPDAAGRLTDPDTLAKVLRYFDADDVVALVDRMLHTDLMLRVPDHNLVMGDRMSMACSLEVRAPFLDPAVVAFAGSLPASLKIRGRQLKVALRRVAERYLPADVVRRPKQGFGFPVGQWMRRELQPLVQSRLAHSRLVAAGVFRAEPIARLVDEHMSGRVDHSYRLWLLLNLDIWHSIYIEGDRVGDVQADVIRLTRSAA
jgi:asparagine synthase (glutamine-hydrolysing)